MKSQATNQAFPDGWQLVPLSDVATVQTGLALGREATTAPVSRPYLRVANVQDGYLDLSVMKTVVVERAELQRYTLRPGDVLMTEGGDSDKLGRGHVWSGEIDGCLHQNHVFAVRPKNGNLLPEYLANLTGSEYGRRYFLSCSKQSTNLASINSSQLKAFPIPLPPLPEQRAIAAVLSAWDRAIRQTTDLIDAKGRLKQGLMQQLLAGKRRFPGFTQPWESKPFGSFLRESRVSGANGAAAKKLTVKLYGKGVIAKHETRSGSAATQYYRRSSGQFIYSKLDFLNGAFGIIPAELNGYESTLDLPAFDIVDQVDPNWLREFVCRPEFYSNQLGLANGGRKARRVNPDDFLKIRVLLPPLAEQRKIAGLLNAIDSELTLLTRQLAALKTQKRGLMRKLLTGEVRVKVPS